MSVLNVTDTDTYNKILSGPLPTLVDFNATWCPPCIRLAPIIDQLADDYAGRLQVVSIDIDACPDLKARYDVQGVPTLILFEGGEVFTRVLGARPRNELVEMIDNAIEV